MSDLGTSSPGGGWEIALAARAALGERPVWDERTGSLLWVDIDAGQLHRFTPGVGDTSVQMGGSAGFVALRENGGVVVGTDAGLVLADATGAERSEPIVAPGMTAAHLFNDGAVDPAGRLFAGTATFPLERGASALYRLDPDHSVHTVLTDITESNGVAWSGDGRTMYYVDSGGQDLIAFDYDVADGSLADRRVLLSIDPADGVPDGLVVDSDDNLWLALWGGWGVRCYQPDGTLVHHHALPTQDITCPAFGGPALEDLYVTSARGYLEEDALAAQPHAGDLFRLAPGVRGRRSNRFAG